MVEINLLEKKVEEKDGFLTGIGKKIRLAVLPTILGIGVGITTGCATTTYAQAQTPNIAIGDTRPINEDYKYSKKDFKGKSLEEVKEFIGYDQKKLESFITKYLKFEGETLRNDELKYPKVTLREKKGDCEDLALEIAEIVEGKYNYDIYFIEIKKKNSSDTLVNHIITTYKDEKGWHTILYKFNVPGYRVKNIGITPAYSSQDEVLRFVAESFGGKFDGRIYRKWNNKQDLIDYYKLNPKASGGGIRTIKEF